MLYFLFKFSKMNNFIRISFKQFMITFSINKYKYNEICKQCTVDVMNTCAPNIKTSEACDFITTFCSSDKREHNIWKVRTNIWVLLLAYQMLRFPNTKKKIYDRKWLSVSFNGHSFPNVYTPVYGNILASGWVKLSPKNIHQLSCIYLNEYLCFFCTLCLQNDVIYRRLNTLNFVINTRAILIVFTWYICLGH